MQWSHLKRVAFRWLFVYLVLYCLPVPPALLWGRLVAWTGDQLGVDATVRLTGSGDTTFHYIQVLLFVFLALVATLVWSLADRRRLHYRRLYLGLRVLVRLRLGISMIGYGAAKLIPSQFGPLPLERLVQTFGDASPMGLLWSFMGASVPYTVFCGAAEMIAGVLLFFPRTAALGAVVSIGVMSNIVALNFSYDVPVKLLSAHMLAMAVFLAAPDARRLANLLVLNRATEPARIETVLQRPAIRRTAFALKMVLLASVTVSSLVLSHSALRANTVESPLSGIWEVEEFTLGGEDSPQLVPDDVRWRRMIVGRSVFVQRMNGNRRRYTLNLDLSAEKLVLDSEFTYSRPSPETLHLAGSDGGNALSVTLKRVSASEFRLTGHGFHWISEFPFNR